MSVPSVRASSARRIDLLVLGLVCAPLLHCVLSPPKS